MTRNRFQKIGALAILVAIASASAWAQPVVWERLELREQNSKFTFSTRMLSIGRDGSLWVALGGKWLARSTDQGDTWDTIATGLESQSYFESMCFASNGDIFAGGSDYIMRSTNNGESFEVVGGDRCNVVSIVEADSGRMYAATFGGSDGVYRSTDYGATWTQTQLVEPPGISIARCVGIGPDGAILAGAQRGLFISRDNGLTYTLAVDSSTLKEPYAIETAPNGTIFMTTQRGMFRSIDSGRTWVRKTPVTFSLLSLNIDRFGHIFTNAIKKGIFRSTDNGDSWSRIDGGSDVGSVVMHTALAPNGRLFATSYESFIYRTVSPVSSVNRAITLPERLDFR